MQLVNVFDLITQHQTQRSSDTAVIDGNFQFTYAEVHHRVQKMSKHLSSLGIEPLDRVAVHLNKSIEEIVAFFAIARLGAVSVNINYRGTRDQCSYILQDCGAKVVVTDERKAPEFFDLEGLTELLWVVTVVGERVEKHFVDKQLPGNTTELETPRLVPDKLATILYTSGSTGMPKGVMLTHEAIIQGAKTVAGYLNNTSHDRILSLLPFSFDYGLNQLTTMCLVGGVTVLQKTAMISSIVDTLQSQKITGLAGVPTLWIDIVRYLMEIDTEFTHLQFITNSGGKIPDKTIEKLPEIFPGVDIYSMYGFTEAFRSTFLPPSLFRNKIGSIGKAVPGVEVHVVHPERGICAANEVGELVHCGSLISSGYWGNQSATEDKIRSCNHLYHIAGDEPVVFSGDLVRYDDDGYIWFVARMDEMIKSNGYRISPTEVEDVIYKSGLVQYAVAFGVDDERRGQVVNLVIVPLHVDFHLEILQRYCYKYLPSYMIPEHFFIWSEPFPTTTNGKIDRCVILDKVRQVSRRGHASEGSSTSIYISENNTVCIPQ